MNNSNLLICISVYKKSIDQLKRVLSSIPITVDVELTFDGGWEPDFELNELSKIHEFYVYKFDHNVGLGAVRNSELIRCNHKYIQFVDADDWVNKELYSTFKYNSDIIIGPVVLTDRGYNAVEKRNIYVAGNNGQTYFIPPAIIFRTEFLKNNNLLFDTSRNIFEDVLFSIKLTELNPTVEITESPIYFGNDVPDEGESLSHPSDISGIVSSTFYVVDQIIEYSKISKRPELCYIRLVEELLRLLRLDLNSEDYNKVINYLKPYKFPGFKL